MLQYNRSFIISPELLGNEGFMFEFACLFYFYIIVSPQTTLFQHPPPFPPGDIVSSDNLKSARQLVAKQPFTIVWSGKAEFSKPLSL